MHLTEHLSYETLSVTMSLNTQLTAYLLSSSTIALLRNEALLPLWRHSINNTISGINSISLLLSQLYEIFCHCSTQICSVRGRKLEVR